MTNFEDIKKQKIDYWKNLSLEEMAAYCLGCDQDAYEVSFITTDGRVFSGDYSESDENYQRAIKAEIEYLHAPVAQVDRAKSF